MKSKMAKRIFITVICAMVILCSPLYAIERDHETNCLHCYSNVEMMELYQMLLEDFYIKNCDVTYYIKYNDTVCAADPNAQFYSATANYYEIGNWDAIVDYINAHAIEIERDRIVEISERGVSATATYLYEKTYTSNVECSECGANSIFGAELWANVNYNTNTGWVTGVSRCGLDIITGSPAHPNYLTYDQSSADWDWGDDETSLVFYGTIDVGYAESFIPDSPMEPGWMLEHYFYDESEFYVTFHF